MIETNCLIKASAGTGKTFALATRFIRLMMLDRVRPETIVALTFSRAAAQEIYTKILTRLCEAAKDEEHAEKEWSNLLQDFRDENFPRAAEKLAEIERMGIPHAASDFSRLLRSLVDTQHLGTIATLDSFILKIVKNFPKEMGFQNAVEVLDPCDEDKAIDNALERIMARTDSNERFVRDFKAITSGVYKRQCISVVKDLIVKSGWRKFASIHPESIDPRGEWSVESICSELSVPSSTVRPDLSHVECNDFGKRPSPEVKFCELVRTYDGRDSFLPKSTVGELIAHLLLHPEAVPFSYTYYSKQYDFPRNASDVSTVLAGARFLLDSYIMRMAEVATGRLGIVAMVEREYDRMMRRAGKLTFEDFARYPADNELSKRGLDILNVMYRFDARFDHWALDEFQDTSEQQWKCLEELVSNVANASKGGEDRTAMAVGDLKQSIYTWRGASARPFETIAAWPAFVGYSRDLKESHRYGPHIADFVNRVFGVDNIKVGGLIDSSCERAVREWSAGWLDHVSHESEDYVKVVAAESESDDDTDSGILIALHRELEQLWNRHKDSGSHDTIGVLVRSNTNGLKVAEYLRAKKLPVVWEGMNPVYDLPIVEVVLCLLRLADHPRDAYAWKVVDELFTAREQLLPDCHTADEVSSAVARSLSCQGLARTLKDYCGKLCEKFDLKLGGLSADRLRQLIYMAVVYEAKSSSDVDGFIDFLGSTHKRELSASSDTIRILTIHRSKGLGFDHVFVPLFEDDRWRSAIDMPSDDAPLYGDGEWVLPHLIKGCEQFNEKTKAAYESMRSDCLRDSLRTYYVALTRAKKSMFVILAEEDGKANNGNGLLMRDLIAQAVGSDKLPLEIGEMPSLAPKKKDDENGVGEDAAPSRWSFVGIRDDIERVSPSSAHRAVGGGRRFGADTLFDAEYGAAARGGIDVHAQFQAIEWATEEELAALPAEFRPAFTKPAGEASVWRERSYEILRGKKWESGKFDRVVIVGSGDARCAKIYDFKTNAMRADESAEEFASRLKATYSAQMAMYRSAVCAMTKLPKERVTATLLLVASGQAVECEDE